ncbi:MAG: hypothetical protein QF570_09405 [Myxococcota bacterium]|jgi:hypothetical protein|nr:hypothetical protein [Myxococcota bacterium]
MTTPARAITPPLPGPPEPIVSALDSLQAIAAESEALHLVGRCVVELTLGIRPQSYRAVVQLAPDQILEATPNAVPTGHRGRTLTLPTAAGPLDLETGSADGSSPTPCRFRIESLAWDSQRECAVGPAEAFEDLEAQRLVPAAAAPLEALAPLEAARWIADYGFRAAPETVALMQSAPGAIPASRRARARHLLRAALLGPHCEPALAFLLDSRFRVFEHSQIEAEAPARVTRVAPRLRPRLTALLVGANARVLLRELHFGGQLSDEVFRVLAWHPIEQYIAAPEAQHSALRRWLKKAPPDLVDDAIAIRRAQAQARLATKEPAGNATRTTTTDDGNEILKSLDLLERAIADTREALVRTSTAPALALSGRDIMQHLDIAPGRVIGKAIRYLEGVIESDPERNAPDALRQALDAWPERPSASRELEPEA